MKKVRAIGIVEEFRVEEEKQNERISNLIMKDSHSGPNKEVKSLSKEEMEWRFIKLQESTVLDTDASVIPISYPPKLETIPSSTKMVDFDFEPEDSPVKELRIKPIEEDKEEEPVVFLDNNNSFESVHNNTNQLKVSFANLDLGDDLLGI